jgi:hypothetical protein
MVTRLFWLSLTNFLNMATSYLSLTPTLPPQFPICSSLKSLNFMECPKPLFQTVILYLPAHFGVNCFIYKAFPSLSVLHTTPSLMAKLSPSTSVLKLNSVAIQVLNQRIGVAGCLWLSGGITLTTIPPRVSLLLKLYTDMLLHPCSHMCRALLLTWRWIPSLRIAPLLSTSLRSTYSKPRIG